MMVQSALPISEQAAIRQYDRRRRLASNQIIVSAFIIILALIIVVFTAYSITQANLATYLIDGVFAVSLGLYGVSYWATRHENLRLAALTTVLSTDMTIIVAALLWITLLGRPMSGTALNPVTFAQFTSLCIPIILAGVLGEFWLVLATTLLMNVAALLFCALIPVDSLLSLFVALVISQQWAFTAITLTISRLYQRTLAELGQAYIQAQQLDQLKDQFITNVNHELRTPVMTLQGYIEFLRLKHAGMSAEQLTTSLDRASRTGYTLLNLLNSILEVRNIDQEMPAFDPETVVVKTALEQALLLIDPREGNFGERDVRVQIPNHLGIWGEPVRVQQILTNLLSNANKYSPAGTPIEVIAQRVADEPRKSGLLGRRVGQHPMIALRVRDYGQGIPPDQVALLFNRFVRLPRDLASNISGNGLGLYLCRVLAESMGGRIWVESTGVAGQGATFHVLIPATTLVASDPDITQPRMHSLARPK